MKENEKRVSFLVEGEDQNGASNLPVKRTIRKSSKSQSYSF
jgi:hypothetical protein